MRKHLPQWLTVGLLILFFALALTSAVRKSPTMDEQNHIARGAAYLGTGDPRLSVEHPPLVNVISALPVHLLLHPQLPLETIWWETGEWYHFADLFLWETNANAGQIVFLARLPVMGLGMLLVALVQRWGTQRFGAWGGLLAAVFSALDPNILAHARLSTTDLGGTFFALLAVYAIWSTLRRPSLGRVLASGVALGLAFAAKLSTLTFGPILALVVGVHWFLDTERGVRDFTKWAGAALGVGILALLVVWASYRFQVGALEGVGMVPAPFYVRGIRAVMGFATGGRPGYLLGQVSTEGWWYYFPVAFAVKTPLPTLLALLGASVLAIARPSRDDLILLLPTLIYFLASMVARLNLGYRHLLPILPFLYIHLGRLLRPVRRGLDRRGRLVQGLVVVLLVGWLGVVAAGIYPHFLAYFNPLAGGPERGWRVLADSNIDWGQDLEGLQTWMEQEGVDRVHLAWFGSARPEYYGIDYVLLPGIPYGFSLWPDPPFDPQGPEPGVYAISVSNLVGAALPDPEIYAWFREREPDAKIGYSVFVFRVEP